MKKIAFISFASLSLVLSSCHMNDENDGRFDDAKSSSGWAQFSSDECVGFVYGSTSEISLPVELHVPVNSDGTQVNYSITDVNGDSSSIIPERSGSFTITAEDQITKVDPASGTTVRYMVHNLVIPVSDAGLASTAEFDVALTSTSKSGVSIGLSDNSKPTVVHVVIRKFVTGNSYVYSGQSTSSTGFADDPFTQTLVSTDGNASQFTTNSAWGVLFVPHLTGNPAAIRDYPANITVNNDNTVTVAGINTPAAPNRYPGGTGTYDPCTDTFDIVLRQGVFTNPFTVRTIYTPVVN